MRVYNTVIFEDTTVASPAFSSGYTLEHMFGFAVQSVFTVNTPANKTFVDADVDVADDEVTIAAHGYITGTAVTLTTTGVLPGGLALATTYYLIVIDANTIKFASSLANALAGTAVDITSAAGGGTHTVNVTALAGASVQMQATNDDFTDPNVTPTWTDIGSAQAITVSGSNMVNFDGVHYFGVRFKVAIASGQLSLTAKINGKGF